jgi:hypothetical protein
MFRRAKGFVQNHWKKVVFGGIAIQIAGYGFRYATNRLLEYQDDQARLYWKKIKKQQHFESLEQNVIITFRELVQVMKYTVITTLDAEALQEGLRNNQIQNKVEAWNELKIIAFTRTLATIYGTSLLYVLLRIQISIIGGYLVNENASAQNVELNGTVNSNSEKISGEVQRKYLSMANHLATSGIVSIINSIKEKVKSVVSQLPLKQTFSGSDLEQTFWTIIRKDSVEEKSLENPFVSSWKYIFPNELLQDRTFFRVSDSSLLECSDIYRKLICETYDLLESEDVKDILRFLESHGVSHLVDRVTETLESVPVESSVESGEVFSEPKIAFPKLISFMNSLHLTDVLDDPWIGLLINSDSVRVMSANIYEAFSLEN